VTSLVVWRGCTAGLHKYHVSFKIENFETQSQYILRLAETTSLWICDVIIGIVTYQAHSVWITRYGVCVVQLTWVRHMILAKVLSMLEVNPSVFLMWIIFTFFVVPCSSNRQIVSPQPSILGVSSIGNRVLREKLPVSLLVKTLLAFYGGQTFITVSTTRQLTLSWIDQSSKRPANFISWRSFLILSSHLCTRQGNF
jgi:hypothetical protein